MSFELVRIYDTAYQSCLAAVLFIITLDLLKPLEFNYHFFMLLSSLKIAKGAIFAFMFIISMDLIGFAALLYLTIGSNHENFKYMLESMNALLLALLGMMKYDDEIFDGMLVKFYFGLYAFSMTITLVNVFIVLLTISFNDVKTGLNNGTLHYDQKLNDHFWFKVDKMLEWMRDRFCFACKLAFTDILYSYLMGVQAIDQNMFPEVLGMTKVFYCPRLTTEGNRTLWSFPLPRGKLFDLLPALPLNNSFIT